MAETMDFSHNRDELRHIDNKSHTEWYKSIDPRTKEKSKCNIFNSLLHFTKDILIENSNDIVCEFSQLLRWRELVSCFGEDLFTTAHLANLDLISKRKRHFLPGLLQSGLTTRCLILYIIGACLNYIFICLVRL